MASHDSTSDVAWYALHTRHQHEKLAARILSTKGFETFLPLYETVRQWKDRTKRLSLPLFPCYIFLRGGLERWLDILTTPGVHGFVRMAGRAAVISEIEIEAVRQLADSALQVEPHPFVNCGDRIRVMSGPLAGIEGILVRKKNQLRLVLSVEMLGKSASVEVDASMVEGVAAQEIRVAMPQQRVNFPLQVGAGG